MTEVPEKYQKLYNKAMSGRSQAASIKMFCLMCMGFDSTEVPLCTDPSCPHYPYRKTGRKVIKSISDDSKKVSLLTVETTATTQMHSKGTSSGRKPVGPVKPARITL